MTATTTLRAPGTTASFAAPSLKFPLRKAISKRLWKIWGAGLTGLLVGAAILAAGYVDAAQLQDLGPGFHSLFDLSAARAIRYFGSVQILLAGQLALFIWWARSRAQQEKGIRHKSWASLAAFCFFASFAIGIDAHVAVAQTIAWAAGEQLSFQPELGWLAPVGCVMVLFLWLLHADVKNCLASMCMLWLAAVAWGAGAALHQGVELPLDEMSTSLVATGAVMFGHWCLLMSMLLHARHVVYGRAVQRHAEASSKRTKPTATKQAASPAKAVSTKPTTQRFDKAERTIVPETKPSALTHPAGASVVQEKGQNATIVTRTDLREERAKAAVVDKALLKGLSKRERREVRKNFREQQRISHGEQEE